MAMRVVAQMSLGSRADGRVKQIQAKPTQTAKERLGGKASDEQRVELPIGSIKPGEKFMAQVSRTDSHCPLQRTMLMEASPPPSDGTL